MRAPVQAVIVVLAVIASHTAAAQGRTDVVTLRNGDRITGEVVRLERGTLEFKTDDAGTLYLEWDKLARVVTTRVVEVVTTDGRRFLGSLGRAPDRSIAVVGAEGTASLQMLDVTVITPIGRSFWRQLDGSSHVFFGYLVLPALGERESTQKERKGGLRFNPAVYRIALDDIA